MSSLTVDGITTKSISANGTIGTAGQLLTANGTGSYWQTFPTAIGLGVGQTWQDVTSSRNIGTTYTNDTGKPIEIFVQLKPVTTGGFSANAYINGALVATNATGIEKEITLIIPNQTSYSISNTSNVNKSKWLELR